MVKNYIPIFILYRTIQNSRNMGKYKTLQLDAEIHAQLQEYCNEHDLRMSKFVGTLIKNRINPPKNVLRVKT